MTYSSTAYRLLISAPRDVPLEDVTIVNDTVGRWNAIYGQQFGAVIVPTHWKLHSTAEHGGRPQAALNEQLVADADILVALFWHRLGSATGEAVSGTVEEIERAYGNGAYVAILRCTRDFPQSSDPEQIQKLRAFFESVEPKSLMLGYSDEAELARHVDAILIRAVTRDSTRAEAAVGTPRAGADVWPRIESSEQARTDLRGRVTASRQWRLVLANSGSHPARNVRYRLEAENEDDDLPFDQNDGRALEVLAPGSEASYLLILHMGVAPQARCIVTWDDVAGEHENRATLRFF